MSKKLYVGNLSFSITEAELSDLFAAKGAVESARLITDRMSGRSKGFGFVEMTNDNEADDAINSLNGTEVSGRQIVVNEARPREEGGGGGFGGGGSRGGYGDGGRRDGGGGRGGYGGGRGER